MIVDEFRLWARALACSRSETYYLPILLILILVHLQNSRFGWLSSVKVKHYNTKQLLATDILVLVTMKSAAKCDT
jgi:hypothetical protein